MAARGVTTAGIGVLTLAALVAGANVASGQAPLPAGPWTTVDEAEVLPAKAGANFWFGRHADLDGDTLAVSGGLFQQGAVFIFVRDASGWHEQAEIRPAGEPLTGACSLDGDRIVVGAYTEATNGTEAGAAYVYRRAGAVWSLEQTLRASDGAAMDHFGSAVDLAGDVLIVGAPQHSAPYGGKAYVFRNDGSACTEEAILAATATSHDDFGDDVAIEGDLAVVGAYDLQSCSIYHCAAGAWTREVELFGDTAGEGFAQTVGLSGDTVVVGAPFRDGLRGGIYVYVRQGGLWPRQALLTTFSGVLGEALGAQAAVDGDLVVGTSGLQEGRPQTGSQKVFRRTGTQWEELGRLVSRTPRSGSRFGSDVTVDAGRVASGAYYADVTGFRSGAAYVFPMFPGAAANYGENSPDSAGVGARMAIAGTASLGGGTTLWALGAPAARSGLFFCGVKPANLPFGNGKLLVSPFSPGLKRLPPLVVTDDFGTAFQELDPARLPPGTAPGSTVFFQLWFRDFAGGAGFNLTDGLAVTFEP